MWPRIAMGAAIMGILLAAGIGAYSDQLKEAAKSEADLTAEAASADRAAEKVAATKELPPVNNERTRWNGLVVGLSFFVLALFVGFALISKVPAKLCTPLLSNSNAVSGVILVGAISVAGIGAGDSFREGLGSFIAMLAVALATFNIVGGFLITHRMLVLLQRK